MSARSEAERLLAELLRAGAIPLVEGGRLAVEAPPGALSGRLREELAAGLPELRALVAARWRAREECVAPRPCRRMTACARPVDGRPCLAPAACCVCGAALPAGHRYLCPACSGGRTPTANRPTDLGEREG